VIDTTDTPTEIGDNGQVKELVNVNNLVKYFPVRGGILQRVVAWVQAVDDVSFTVREGETLGWWENPAAEKAQLATASYVS
jgi:ABC-type microcin C transport system duplicated ATPase subunit YejF